jgi:hypothetical protein
MSLRRAVRPAIGRWRSPAKTAGQPSRQHPRRVPLADGIRHDNRTIRHLDFRPADMSDFLPLAQLKANDLGDALRMISRISGEPYEALSVMTQDDAVVVLTAFAAWMDSENARLTKVLNTWQS